MSRVVRVPLENGLVATADAADEGLIAPYRWHARRMWKARQWYAIASAGRGSVVMHRLILGLDKGVRCDHINGDTLDNRRENLRPATVPENAWNIRAHADSQSGYKGVSPTPEGRWIAQITASGRRLHLGTFDSPEEAARIYNRGARLLHGEFARLNDVEEEEE